MHFCMRDNNSKIGKIIQEKNVEVTNLINY